MNSEKYNGWKNFETWNVALWIGNDEAIYALAKSYQKLGYARFVDAMAGIGSPIGTQTPDGVAWNNPSLDIKALDGMIKEL